MLAVISPAKKLDYDTPVAVKAHTQPEMLDDAAELIEQLRALSPQEVGSLMKLSDPLASLNFGRYADWHRPFTPDNARQAIFAFRGDVYVGLDADSLAEDDLAWAQDHLRILSGLYGLLRPLDLMQPYRLEMGTRFANHRGRNLYQFWGDTLTRRLNALLAEQASPVLVNLASDEYFKSVQVKQLSVPVVSPVFKDRKGDQYKIISFYAKKARGLMARYLIEQRLDDPEGLKGFDAEGYRYNAAASTPEQPVFLRDAPPA